MTLGNSKDATMSMDILDLKTKKAILDVNVWTAPSLFWAVRQSGLFSPDRIESFGACISMAEITQTEARALGKFVREHVLPAIPDGGRMFPDGDCTAEPDDNIMHTGADRKKNFGVDRAFFEKLAEICEQSGGMILR